MTYDSLYDGLLFWIGNSFSFTPSLYALLEGWKSGDDNRRKVSSDDTRTARSFERNETFSDNFFEWYRNSSRHTSDEKIAVSLDPRRCAAVCTSLLLLPIALNSKRQSVSMMKTSNTSKPLKHYIIAHTINFCCSVAINFVFCSNTRSTSAI